LVPWLFACFWLLVATPEATYCYSVCFSVALLPLDCWYWLANLFGYSCACFAIDLSRLTFLLEDSRDHTSSWLVLAGLCGILLLGPWYREFVGGLTVLIIFLGNSTYSPPYTISGCGWTILFARALSYGHSQITTFRIYHCSPYSLWDN